MTTHGGTGDTLDTNAGGGTDVLPTLRVRGPEDLVHAVPYLLGFHPSRSLVLVGLRERRVAVTARLDLVDVVDAGGAIVASTIAAMHRGGADRFVAIVYDDDAVPAAEPAGRPLPWSGVAAEVGDAITAVGAAVDDTLLVSGRRVWSYACADDGCCPAGGRPLQEGSEVAACATYAGLVALPDRASLAARLDPEPGRATHAGALRAAEQRVVRFGIEGRLGIENRSVTRSLFAAARAAQRPGGASCSDAALVRFGVALRRIPVRDSVWMAIDDRRLDGRDLWLGLARRLPAPYDAAPLFLLGWGSWRRGDGALANIAAERALAADPGYTAADLLLAAVSSGVDPRRLPRLRGRRTG